TALVIEPTVSSPGAATAPCNPARGGSGCSGALTAVLPRVRAVSPGGKNSCRACRAPGPVGRSASKVRLIPQRACEAPAAAARQGYGNLGQPEHRAARRKRQARIGRDEEGVLGGDVQDVAEAVGDDQDGAIGREVSAVAQVVDAGLQHRAAAALDG